jgi:hypothetical protein
MRMLIIIVASLCFQQIVASTPQRYGIPRCTNVGVYENETRKPYDTALCTLSSTDRVGIIDAKEEKYLIKSEDGRIGWVEKSCIAITERSSLLLFENKDIVGFLNEVSPIYIIAGTDPSDIPLRIDRSFKEQLLSNQEKASFQRRTNSGY